MYLEITPDKNIHQVQLDFQKVFPYLKLYFFTKPHKVCKGTNSKFMANNQFETMGELCTKKSEGVQSIDGNMTTWQLEHQMEEEFGLFVQVFRHSGKVWLETSATDSLTLFEQNAKGERAENVVTVPNEMPDYREMD